MRDHGFVSVLAALIVLSLAAPAAGYTLMDRTTTFNVQAGLISPGTFWVGDYEADTDMSFSLAGGLDYKLGPKISGGPTLAINNFSGYDDSSTMLEFGFLLKAWVNSEGSNLLFRPGFGISYGRLGSIGGVDSSNYLVINGVVEMVMMRETGLNWLVMLGITGAPTGGNEDFDMTYGPGFILRGGVNF